jgi:hypothetical protein
MLHRRQSSQALLTVFVWCLLGVLTAFGPVDSSYAAMDTFKDYDKMSADNYAWDRNRNGIPDDCESGAGRRFSRTAPWRRPEWHVIPMAVTAASRSVCMFPRALTDSSRWLCIDVVAPLGDSTAPAVIVFGSDRQALEVRTIVGRNDRRIRVSVVPVRPWPIGTASVLIVTGQDSLWGAVRVKPATSRHQ